LIFQVIPFCKKRDIERFTMHLFEICIFIVIELFLCIIDWKIEHYNFRILIYIKTLVCGNNDNVIILLVYDKKRIRIKLKYA